MEKRGTEVNEVFYTVNGLYMGEMVLCGVVQHTIDVFGVASRFGSPSAAVSHANNQNADCENDYSRDEGDHDVEIQPVGYPRYPRVNVGIEAIGRRDSS